MNVPRVRVARKADAPFLARAILTADRGHTGVGSWDIALPGSDDERLDVLESLVRASVPSYLHWTTFCIAEADGTAVGAAAGYIPARAPSTSFEGACLEVLGSERAREVLARRAWSRNFFTVSMTPHALRIEWVHTAESARRRGVSTTVIAAVLKRALDEGASDAYVGTYIGNAAAIATYKSSGFAEFAELRHSDYHEQFGTPGLMFLRRSLSGEVVASEAR